MGTVEERFWRNVVHGRGCWTYENVGGNGYGKLLVNGKHTRAHRLAWKLTNGVIPTDMLVCHSCDNPSCVRPDHLFLGTNADNSADMNAKGRTARGERCAPRNPARGERDANAVLTAAKVRRIRLLYATGRISQQKIADSFGVNQTCISAVVRRFTWAHVR